MSGRFVRQSKYRHVFGRSTRKDQCYDNVRVSKNAWDTNLVQVNPKYLSVNWDTSGGGAFAVIPLAETGKLPDRIPLFRGHTAVVLDTDWNPFNDDLIASGSDDGKVFLWRVPDGFTCRPPVEDSEEIADVAPVAKLAGHPRKVGHVVFNPSAEGVLASASGDYTVKIWDVEAGAAKLTLNVGDIAQSVSWSGDGSMLVTTSRDKKLRIWDPRAQAAVITTPGHTGAKNSRAVWLGTKDRVVTTGFSKMSDRQFALWDIKAPGTPVGGFRTLDSISGVCMPFWDDGTQCLYLAGKGDGNIRYFEYASDKFEYLAEYQSADPQRGIGFMPKRGVNMHDNEVVRAFKTVSDSYIEPISFIVPRRSEQFQDDIYPPTTGLTPAMGAADWFGGKDGVPPLLDMASLFEGHGMKQAAPAEVKEHTPIEVDQAKKPQQPEQQRKASGAAAAAAAAPASTPASASTSGPASPVAARKASAASLAAAKPAEPKEAKQQVADQKQALSDMADKFADRDDDEDHDEDGDAAETAASGSESSSKKHRAEPSAFDEEPEREPRSPARLSTPVKAALEAEKRAFSTGTSPAAAASATPSSPAPASETSKPAASPVPLATRLAGAESRAAALSPASPASPLLRSPGADSASPSPALASPLLAAEAVDEMKTDLRGIKEMLAAQQKVIERQTGVIEQLVAQVEALKAHGGLASSFAVTGEVQARATRGASGPAAEQHASESSEDSAATGSGSGSADADSAKSKSDHRAASEDEVD